MNYSDFYTLDDQFDKQFNNQIYNTPLIDQSDYFNDIKYHNSCNSDSLNSVDLEKSESQRPLCQYNHSGDKSGCSDDEKSFLISQDLKKNNINPIEIKPIKQKNESIEHFDNSNAKQKTQDIIIKQNNQNNKQYYFDFDKLKIFIMYFLSGIICIIIINIWFKIQLKIYKKNGNIIN